MRTERSTAAAVDRESEKVLNTADEGTTSSEKATIPAPKPENPESDDNGDIEKKTEVHSTDDTSVKVQGDEKFDDVPI